MTIEKVMNRIKHEIKCHKKELEKIIKKKEIFEKDESQEIESMLNMLRGIQLQAKIDQLEVLLLVFGDPEMKMEFKNALSDTCKSKDSDYLDRLEAGGDIELEYGGGGLKGCYLKYEVRHD